MEESKDNPKSLNLNKWMVCRKDELAQQVYDESTSKE